MVREMLSEDNYNVIQYLWITPVLLSPTESTTSFSRIPPLLSIVLLENMFPLSQVSNNLCSPISLQIGNNNFIFSDC